MKSKTLKKAQPDVTGQNRTESDGLRGLTPKQRSVIPYLLNAGSLESACEKAGISKTTVYAWLQQKAFKSAVEQLRNEIIENALTELKQGISKAVDKLLFLVDAEEKYIALRAAERTIEFFIKMKEIRELEERIEALERGASIIVGKEGTWKHDTEFDEET